MSASSLPSMVLWSLLDLEPLLEYLSSVLSYHQHTAMLLNVICTNTKKELAFWNVSYVFFTVHMRITDEERMIVGSYCRDAVLHLHSRHTWQRACTFASNRFSAIEI